MTAAVACNLYPATHACLLPVLCLRLPPAAAVTYNDGFLGQENEDYQKWILDKKHWGGAIELSILSKHYDRVIAAYDIQTKRCDRCVFAAKTCVSLSICPKQLLQGLCSWRVRASCLPPFSYRAQPARMTCGAAAEPAYSQAGNRKGCMCHTQRLLPTVLLNVLPGVQVW